MSGATALAQGGYWSAYLTPPPDMTRYRSGGIVVDVGCGQGGQLRDECHGVLCKVVLPYTDERRTIAEIARVLAKGGVAVVYLHGLGYSLRYLLKPEVWKLSVYAARTIVNTIIYRLTGRRLPGFLGDTIFQSDRRLRRYYRSVGLTLESTMHSRRFLGQAVFIGHVVRK